MADDQRPTVRSRRLGMMLRSLREERGLSPGAAARLLNRDRSSLSKLETGHRGIRRPALENMLDKYGVDDTELRELLYTLAEDARTKGWWRAYDGTLSHRLVDYIGLEQMATAIEVFELHLIPGLLQTPAYARAIIAAGVSLGENPNARALLDVRLRRQRILTTPDPPTYTAIISEAALHQQVGGAAVRLDQLHRLLEAATLSNVTLQILPFTAGASAGLNGSFTRLHLDSGALEVVLVESLTTGWYLETGQDLRRYRVVMDHLRAQALPEDSSRAMIEGLLSDA